MFPLLRKDGVLIPYFCLLLLFLSFAYYIVKKSHFRKLIIISLIGMLLIHILEILIPPPAKLPDLWLLIYAIYSFIHFVVFYCYIIFKQYELKNNLTFINSVKIRTE